METNIRQMQVSFHLKELRDEAASHRLARGGQDRAGSANQSSRIPRTIGALRRLVGTASA